MGVIDTLINSVVSVIAFILGLVTLIAGSLQVTSGSQIMGYIVFLLGIILLVFSAKL